MPAASRRRAAAEPRGRLSREQVVDAALALADAEGLEALSIRRLAVSLGVTPMALYWHVADKDALLQALGERLFASVALPERVDDWYDDLHGVCAAVVAALAAHPRVSPLALPTVVTSEAGAVVAERVLARLVEAGLTDREAADTGAFLLGAMVTLVTSLPAVRGEVRDDRADALAAKAGAIAALPADAFPTVRRLAGQLVDCDEPAAYLQRGVQLLLHGVRGVVGAA